MFRPKHLWFAVLLVVALPIVALAAPLAGLFAIAGAIHQISIALIATGASYGLGRIAQALAPKAKPTELGRQDIRVSTAREGEGIKRFYSRFAGAGHVHYAGYPPTWNPGTQASGGKSRTPPAPGYYSMSFGVLVGLNDFNNCLGVVSVKLNNQTKYEVNPITLDGTNSILLGIEDGTQTVAGGARRFQILLGREDQTERCSWYEQDVGGTIGVPAHRGLIGVYWDDLDLRPYYGTLPQVLVEVQMADGTFRQIIAAESELAGVDPDTELDVTRVSESASVPGMFLEGPTPPKQAFEAMGIIAPFRIVEADGVLKAFSLVPGSVATVAAGDLGAYVGGIEDRVEKPAKTSLEFEQHDGLPIHLEIGYFDGTNNYEQASRPYFRPYGLASGTQQLFLPMALAADKVKSVASHYLTTAYAEGDPWTGTLPPAYAEYHPGDILTVPEPDGTYIDVRLERMVFEPGGLVESVGVRVLRLTGGGVPSDDPHVEPPEEPNTGQLAVDCVWLQSNAPPLIDDHDGFAGMYWAAVPKTIPTTTERAWTGATLYRNACGSDDTYKVYRAMARTQTAATIGKAMTALADETGLDITNTVDIHLPYGGGDVAMIGVLDDAFTKTTVINLCILGREVLQFRDVEDVSDEYGGGAFDGTHFRLSHLKRGLRTTEHQTATHAIDEAFVMWSAESLIRVPVNMNEQVAGNNVWSYKTLSDGQEELDILPMFFTFAHDGETQLKEDA